MKSEMNGFCLKLGQPLKVSVAHLYLNSGRSRPSHKWEGGAVSKNHFLALWASVWPKNKGGGPSPGSATAKLYISAPPAYVCFIN